jgi:hypothetical protein
MFRESAAIVFYLLGLRQSYVVFSVQVISLSTNLQNSSNPFPPHPPPPHNVELYLLYVSYCATNKFSYYIIVHLGAVILTFFHILRYNHPSLTP